MKIERWLFVLTGLNLVLLVALLAQWQPASAQGTAPVLRGRALEIIDDQGRVRASISLLPADRGANAGPFPETVILRLIDRNGKPKVKLATSDESSALGLLGDSDSTQALIEAQGPNSLVRLRNRNGQQQLVKP